MSFNMCTGRKAIRKTAAILFNGQRFPMSFILDKEENIREISGLLNEDKLETIEKLLSESSIKLVDMKSCNFRLSPFV